MWSEHICFVSVRHICLLSKEEELNQSVKLGKGSIKKVPAYMAISIGLDFKPKHVDFQFLTFATHMGKIEMVTQIRAK